MAGWGLLALLVSAHSAGGQTQAPGGLFRATLIQWEGASGAGTLSLRLAEDDQVYRCGFDSRTYIEKDFRRATMAAATDGQPVEVLLLRDGARCRTLIFRMTPLNTRLAPRGQTPWRSGSPLATEWFAPRGDILVTGLVVRLLPDQLFIKTRTGERQSFRLRRDTRFSAGGQVVDAADLPPYTQVQVRGGRSLDNDIEAYSVIWGEILQPNR